MNILNAILLKIATICFLLSILFPLFGLIIRKSKKQRIIYKLAKFSNTYHEYLGKAALLIAVVHGVISDVKFFSFNFGTICIVLIVISIIPSAFHKKEENDIWRKLHIGLSVLPFIAFVLHIVLESL